MRESTIRQGDLCWETDRAGNLRITRQSTMQSIQLSISELAYTIMVDQLRQTPIAPPVEAGAGQTEPGTQ
jgi:hypothetical protein